jgi:predicted enzyme related to lactoylglutathione lyase
MITGVHTMFYSSEPAALRTFLRDKLQFPFTDVGDGWLIFDLPAADMGCHPADPANGAASGRHDISFFCDDIRQTVAELKQRGVEFTDEIADHGYGLVTHFRMPGGMEIQLYQPRYVKKPARKPRPAARKKSAGRKPARPKRTRA